MSSSLEYSDLVYTVREAYLSTVSPYVAERFVQMERDEQATAFVSRKRGMGDSMRDMFAGVLKKFVSITDANGIAGRGSMFIFSKDQIEKLIGSSEVKRDLMLDIGAGDGNVTQAAAHLFERVVTTEVSAPMVYRLRRKGWTAIRSASVTPETFGRCCYDAVFCLNVLDRASRPIDLLKNIWQLLKSDGILILAVVLPFCPFVEDGKRKLKPEQTLKGMDGGFCTQGATYERSLILMIQNVLVPLGFELVRWTRLPYICDGDDFRQYYTLDDAVMVLRKKGSSSEEAAPPPFFNAKRKGWLW